MIQEAANVETPPIRDPINPALAERIAVSISNLTLNQLFSYSAAAAVADSEVSVGLICWTRGRAAGLSLSRMAWNVT